MKLPNLKRLVREDFPDAPDWLGDLFDTINPFIESVYSGFNHQLTFGDNLGCQVATVEFTTPASYVAPDAILSCAATLDVSSTTTSVANNTQTILDYNLTVKDATSLIDAGTNWRMTVPAGGSGLWLIGAGMRWVDNTAFDTDEYYGLRILVNGAQVSVIDFNDDVPTTRVPPMFGATALALNDGDYVQVAAIQMSGGSATVETTSNERMARFFALRVSDGPGTAAGFPTVKFAKTLKTKTQGILPIGLVDKTSTSYAPIYKPVSIDWRELDDGKSIQINHVSGVQKSKKYALTMLVL